MTPAGAAARLVAELKRRNVLRMAGLYLVGAWFAVQVASTLLPAFDAPSWVLRAVIVVLAIGFVLVLVFAWTFELTPDGLKRDEGAAVGNPIAASTARRLDRSIIVVLACALAYFATDKFVIEPRVRTSPEDGVSNKSIAVMPLANTSGDPANEYFSDGLSEELINTLGKAHDLTVIGRTSSFRFKGKLGDPKDIAEALGVAYLLEGSVRKVADRVRISVNLVQASSGVDVWSETYDHDLHDIFAVQSEIAHAVAEKLRATLLGGGAKRDATRADNQPPNDSVPAYTALMQANFYANKQTETDHRKAIEYYDEAVRIDPDYGIAYAGLARAWSDLAAIWLVGDENAVAWRNARSAAARAIKLVPDASNAHQALADIRLQGDFDLAGADTEYRRAIELAPADPTPKIAYGGLLSSLGRQADAIALYKAGLGIDPLRTEGYVFYARALVALGRYDEAAAIARKGIELQPSAARLRAVLTEIAILHGDYAQALAVAKQESEGFWREFAMTLALQKQGDAAAADAALRTFIDTFGAGAGSQIAAVFALRGEPDRLFEWIDRGYDARDVGSLFLPLTDPFLLKYANDSRFVAYRKKAGLPALKARE